MSRLRCVIISAFVCLLSAMPAPPSSAKEGAPVLHEMDERWTPELALLDEPIEHQSALGESLELAALYPPLPAQNIAAVLLSEPPPGFSINRAGGTWAEPAPAARAQGSAQPFVPLPMPGVAGLLALGAALYYAGARALRLRR